MTTRNKQFLSAVSFEKLQEKLVFASDDFKRVEQYNDLCSQTVDIHMDHGVRIHYLRVSSEDAPKKINILKVGTISHVLEGNEFGILLRDYQEKGRYTIWLPAPPGMISFDEHQRIVTSSESRPSYKWEIYPHLQLNLSEPGRTGDVVTVIYVVLEDPYGLFYDELKSLNGVERRFYQKIDWFLCKTPSDVWTYLINGSIYHPHPHIGIDKRFKCQQCAFAWWNYFGFLHKETGKKVYSIMKNEISYSVFLDMSEKGEWGHGYWSDNIETHARFHLDGIHLLISQYEKTGQSLWLKAAEQGMDFVFKNLLEILEDDMLWFLHDTLERHNKGIHPLFKPMLFGKKLGTSLCLNTHVQALTVLYRLKKHLSYNTIYSEMYAKGLKALKKVLDQKPAEVLYRLLMPWIIRNRVIQNKIKNKPILRRIKNSLGHHVIKKIYCLLRLKFPRIVLPGGFIERDINVSVFSEIYHIINLKDLLTLYRQEPFDWLRPYIQRGSEFERNYIEEVEMANAIGRSLYYLEYIDILYLYDKLIESIPSGEIDSIEKKIYQLTGGYSLDFFASELVRGV